MTYTAPFLLIPTQVEHKIVVLPCHNRINKNGDVKMLRTRVKALLTVHRLVSMVLKNVYVMAQKFSAL